MTTRPLLLLALLWAPPLAAGPLVVIVNPASKVERMTREEVLNLFMGRTRKLPSGVLAIPVDQEGAAPERAAFYLALAHKELPEISAYWARLLFSGQASPPRQAAGTDEVLDMVRSNKGAIGYIDQRRVDKRVRVVLEVGP
jgi:ABC-type phosphate transport system substrate-binding protein